MKSRKKERLKVGNDMNKEDLKKELNKLLKRQRSFTVFINSWVYCGNFWDVFVNIGMGTRRKAINSYAKSAGR